MNCYIKYLHSGCLMILYDINGPVHTEKYNMLKHNQPENIRLKSKLSKLNLDWKSLVSTNDLKVFKSEDEIYPLGNKGIM